MLPGLGREPADVPLLVQNDDGDVDGVQQVDEIGVDLARLQVAAVQLVVDRGQLFVGRLQLLLRRLQLLVEALQLFVARDQLLVGRAEIVVGPAVLLDQGVQVFRRRRQLVLEHGHAAARPSADARLGAFPPAGLALGLLPGGAVASSNSTTKSRSLTSGRPANGSTTRSHVLVNPPCSTSTPSVLTGALSAFAARQGRAQLREQAAPRHLDDVVLRLSRRGLQIGAGLPAKLEDLHPLVDQNPGRARSAPAAGCRGACRRPLLRGGEAAAPPRRRDPPLCGAPRSWARSAARWPARAREDLARLVHGREQLTEPGDVLRATEQQEARLIQAVVEHRQDALLQRLIESR